ncbi:NAD-dependent protein deacylase [Bacillus tianshenii]|nr:NAD-dependent protein deacylase [Bacillus tianshenii]
MENKINQLKEFIQQAEKICFLTGAGVSTESGIPDFRSQSGLWTKNVGFEEVVSRAYFEQYPEQFWKYFKDIFRTKLLGSYTPNSGHQFIAELEQQGKDVSVITQNIDGLHQKAGSSNVFEIHGTIQQAHCPACLTEYDLDYLNKTEIPRCETEACKTILKPNVVLFGDMIHHFEEATEAALNCDLFIVLGSSLAVTPINQIPQYVALNSHATTVLINREQTLMDSFFDLHLYKGIGETVSLLKQQASRSQ